MNCLKHGSFPDEGTCPVCSGVEQSGNQSTQWICCLCNKTMDALEWARHWHQEDHLKVLNAEINKYSRKGEIAVDRVYEINRCGAI